MRPLPVPLCLNSEYVLIRGPNLEVLPTIRLLNKDSLGPLDITTNIGCYLKRFEVAKCVVTIYVLTEVCQDRYCPTGR